MTNLGVEGIITIAKLIIDYQIYVTTYTAGNKPRHSMCVPGGEITTRFINVAFYKLRFVNTVY